MFSWHFKNSKKKIVNAFIVRKRKGEEKKEKKVDYYKKSRSKLNIRNFFFLAYSLKVNARS